VRHGRYYAQMTREDEHTGRKQVRRVPLEGGHRPQPKPGAAVESQRRAGASEAPAPKQNVGERGTVTRRLGASPCNGEGQQELAAGECGKLSNSATFL
jgi:hypothetical protein